MVNVKLDGDVIKKCFIGKVFPSADVNSITFSQDGTNLLASNQADQILVINSEKGTQTRVVNTNKYGVGLIQFANCNETAIYCSTKINDDIRLLNIPDTKYVRYFVGHKLPVISLDMCPEYGGNAFLSTSLDRTLRIWDTRAVNHQSILHAKGHVIGAYDREGITFAAGIDSKWIKLYDSRYFERGPFSTFQIDKTRGCQWQKLKFAPDGRTILITTRNSLICQIDAYTGSVQHIFTGFENNRDRPVEATFTQDSQYILSGSVNGLIHIWDADIGHKINTSKDERYTGPFNCIAFNPKYMMFATAGTDIALWVPNLHD